ncbi:MAG: hypothetical protein ACK4TC_14585 [Sphingomonas pseudosanguinis]|uniref:hypothetical protein n=1 Tax=Sphingomonas pseudosanguinis TaxID=413712 RepID=UPI00391DA527
MDNKKNLPDWPRLMPEKMAASYLSLSIAAFRAQALCPVDACGRRVLYDRRSLDLCADRLSGLTADDSDLDAQLEAFGRK